MFDAFILIASVLIEKKNICNNMSIFVKII